MGLHVTECAEVKQKTNKHTPEVLIPSDRFLCHYRKVDSQNEELIWKERYFHICESMMYNVLLFTCYYLSRWDYLVSLGLPFLIKLAHVQRHYGMNQSLISSSHPNSQFGILDFNNNMEKKERKKEKKKEVERKTLRRKKEKNPPPFWLSVNHQSHTL